MPFVWNAWDGFPSDLSIITIEMGATMEVLIPTPKDDGIWKMSTAAIASSKGTLRGVLRRDIIGLTGAATSNFESMPEIADFAADIGKTLAGWDKLVPGWKANQLASTENWLILGGAYLYLKEYR